MMITIETPGGSRLKYVYDSKVKGMQLKKFLPTGLFFPFDFGFIPYTKGEDEDPLDVMMIAEFNTFPGCHVDCRIIGCLTAEHRTESHFFRNDRYLAIPLLSRTYASVNSIEELPNGMTDEIETFFVTYLKAEGIEVLFGERQYAQRAITTITENTRVTFPHQNG